jgi:hypothetical protein
MNNRNRDRAVVPDQVLAQQLTEHIGRLAAAHTQLKAWSTDTQIPHTALPSIQSAARFMVIAGDHLNAALTLLNSEQ